MAIISQQQRRRHNCFVMRFSSALLAHIAEWSRESVHERPRNALCIDYTSFILDLIGNYGRRQLHIETHHHIALITEEHPSLGRRRFRRDVIRRCC